MFKHVFESKVESYRWSFDFCTMLTILKPPKHTILLIEASEKHYPANWKFGKPNTISLEFMWVSTPKVQVLYPSFESTFPLRSCDEHKNVLQGSGFHPNSNLSLKYLCDWISLNRDGSLTYVVHTNDNWKIATAVYYLCKGCSLSLEVLMLFLIRFPTFF